MVHPTEADAACQLGETHPGKDDPWLARHTLEKMPDAEDRAIKAFVFPRLKRHVGHVFTVVDDALWFPEDASPGAKWATQENRLNLPASRIAVLVEEGWVGQSSPEYSECLDKVSLAPWRCRFRDR